MLIPAGVLRAFLDRVLPRGVGVHAALADHAAVRLDEVRRRVSVRAEHGDGLVRRLLLVLDVLRASGEQRLDLQHVARPHVRTRLDLRTSSFNGLV